MMTNLDKDKKNNDKQYFIPMEVTPETIRAFNLKKSEEIVWQKIGNKPVRVIMIPATKEQYYEYMRSFYGGKIKKNKDSMRRE